MSVLDGRTISAQDISGEIGIPEKEVFDHLLHIRKSLNRRSRSLIVTPSECRKCGFVFRERQRLSKPGRCPNCRGESISYPLFSITPRGE
jgi:predicted Zn-ribbon and HTH transcriptional regulator